MLARTPTSSHTQGAVGLHSSETGNLIALDLWTPSFRAAYAHARPLAVAGDRKGAARLFTRLLCLVPVEDGGLVGLTEEGLEARCARDPRLDYAAALEALWNPGAWPTPPASEVRGAA